MALISRISILLAALTVFTTMVTDAKAQEYPSQVLETSVDTSFANYGFEVATHGKWLFVNSNESPPSGQLAWNGNSDQGVVYVYERTSSGWSFFEILESPSRTSNTFGECMATNGDVLLVGDVNDRWNTLQYPDGLVFVYRYDGARWKLQQSLQPTSTQGFGVRFGDTIKISNGRAVIVAPSDRSVGWIGGRFYVYNITASGLVLTDSLVPPIRVGPGPGNVRVNYGNAMDFDGSYIAYAGKRHANLIVETTSGWVTGGYAVEPPGLFYDFGESIAIEGDTLVVGRPGDTSLAPRAGRVEIYQRPQAGVTEWVHSQSIVPSNSSTGAGISDWFGQAMCMEDDLLVVGAFEGFTFSGSPNGQLYVFERDQVSGVWTESARLTNEQVETQFGSLGLGLRFGDRLSVSDGVVVAPDWAAPVAGNSLGRGRVFIYERQVGDISCAAQPNSVSAQGASLKVSGSTNASFGYLTFELGQLPAGTSAILLAARSAAMSPVGAGTLCLGSDVSRIPGGLFSANAMGSASLELAYQGVPALAPQPGERILFQAWYRDVGVGGSNLTDAVAVDFE